MVNPNIDDLISEAEASYGEALELLEQEDYYDAAEKAWKAIEILRKAILVAAKVPYPYAKSVNIGLPLFSDFLRNIGKNDILNLYDKLAYRLHIMGFYEGVIAPEELKELILNDARILIEELEKIVRIAEKADLREALESLLKIQKLKRKIAIQNAELTNARIQYKSKLSLIASKLRNIL